jgi:hypothetical protein
VLRLKPDGEVRHGDIRPGPHLADYGLAVGTKFARALGQPCLAGAIDPVAV